MIWLAAPAGPGLGVGTGQEMGEQLRQLRHIPDQAASLQRGRLEAALRRLNEMYMWQTIDVDEYQRQRTELTTKVWMCL